MRDFLGISIAILNFKNDRRNLAVHFCLSLLKNCAKELSLSPALKGTNLNVMTDKHELLLVQHLARYF